MGRFTLMTFRAVTSENRAYLANNRLPSEENKRSTHKKHHQAA